MKCPVCDGKGKIPDQSASMIGVLSHEKCWQCNGRGYILDDDEKYNLGEVEYGWMQGAFGVGRD